MTYKTRKYKSEAWIRHKKRKSRKFYKQLIIALILTIIGTIIGVYIGLYLEHTPINQSLINVRTMIFGG